MTWISLVCLLALTSTAFGRYIYGGAYGSAPTYQQAPRMLTMMREQMIQRPRPSPFPVVSQAYGQQQPLTTEWSTPLVQQQDTSFQPRPQGGYGSALVTPTIMQKTLPVQSYGQISQGYNAIPIISQLDQQIQVQPLTQADILCQGQQAETIIPLENGWKFVVCLDNGKGVEQQCPKGLYYHPTSQRCERKLGPLENACATQPCLNGGQCIPTDSSYQCQCAPGFDGTTCELDARVCQTQQPCGQAPDTKCQSFRLGAALQYMCIFQDGLAYGLSVNQAISSPCQGVDGPQALAITNHGFIMCDGERMFVESCPGGTLWDDINKACAWPDMQADTIQAAQQQGYGQSSYSQQRTVVSQPTYGNQLIAQQQLPTATYSTQTLIPQQFKTLSSYDSQANNQQFDQSQLGQSSSSYGSQITVPQQVKTIQPSYGAQIVVPQQLDQFSAYGAQTVVPQQVKTISSYGSQSNNQQLDQSQLGQSLSSSSSYGNQWTVPQVKQLQSYGNQIISRHFEQPKQIQQTYGARLVVPQQVKTLSSYDSQANNQQFDQSQFGQLSSSSSYGSQITVPQKVKTIQPSYGAQIVVPQQFDQSSAYGAQTVVPQQVKTIQPSYGAQTLVPQPQPQIKVIESSYTGQTLIPQQQKDELVSEVQSSGY